MFVHGRSDRFLSCSGRRIAGLVDPKIVAVDQHDRLVQGVQKEVSPGHLEKRNELHMRNELKQMNFTSNKKLELVEVIFSFSGLSKADSSFQQCTVVLCNFFVPRTMIWSRHSAPITFTLTALCLWTEAEEFRRLLSKVVTRIQAILGRNKNT